MGMAAFRYLRSHDSHLPCAMIFDQMGRRTRFRVRLAQSLCYRFLVSQWRLPVVVPPDVERARVVTDFVRSA